MSFDVNIIITKEFQKQAKKLVKKYRSLRGELKELFDLLEQSPTIGILLTENVYKIRLAVKSKGKGKSGGLRVITYVDVKIEKINNQFINVYLLSVYDKSNQETISRRHLDTLIEAIEAEIVEEKQDSEIKEPKKEDKDSN